MEYGCTQVLSRERGSSPGWLSVFERRLTHPPPLPSTPSVDMSIYTVREISGKGKASSNLEARGMYAKTVSMSSLEPLALPEFPQIAYKLYTKLLPAFMVSCHQITSSVSLVVVALNQGRH